MGFPSARVTASRLTMGALMACMASFATAQEESTNQVAAKTAWSVFEDSDPRECWAVSSPTKVVNTKDGRVVSVRRGDTLLMTFYRPDAQVDGQVTFTGGYPFSDGSTVTLTVGERHVRAFHRGRMGLAGEHGGRRQDHRRHEARDRGDRDRAFLARHDHGRHVLAAGLHRRGGRSREALSVEPALRQL
jgi:hypothetical protein